MSRLSTLLFLALLCAACDRAAPKQEEREYAASLMQGLLAYPQSTLVDVSSGADAAQVTLVAPAPVQTVATWYRQMLRLNGWDLQNDAVTNDSSVVVFAQQGKRPLWITFKADRGGQTTTYTLIGAELPKDSVKDSTAPQRSGSSMSSNRIQRR